MKSCCLALLLAVGSPAPALGAAPAAAPEGARARSLYRYRDDRGTVSFTDRLQAVPERYRSRAERVALPPRAAPAPQRAPAAPPPPPAQAAVTLSPTPTPTPSPTPSTPMATASLPSPDAGSVPAPDDPPPASPAGGRRHVAALAVILLAPLLHRGVCVLCRSLSSQQLSMVIRFTFMVTVPLLLLYLYSREVVATYFRAKRDIAAFQARRNQQVEQNIRVLGELGRDR